MLDRLRDAFDEGYVACHSLKPTRHPRKRFPEASVTVLSPFELAESSVAAMPAGSAHRVRRLDEYSMRDSRGAPGDRVGFARIEEFKGLENDAIIVVDLPDPTGGHGGSAAHYVAMSRARSVLSLIHRRP